jgi:hypothetical protein
MDDGAAHRGKDIVDLVESFSITADHDRQRAVDRFRLTAADRSVEHLHTALTEGLGDLLSDGGCDRTHVNIDQIRPGTANDAIGT